MAVRFIIDSAADVLPAECEKLGVTHVPLTVIFGDEEYADGVTMTPDAFYRELTTNPNHPKTSQVTPAAFEAAYERLCANGDEVVVLTISSRLSGTYQSAVIAAEEYEDRVFVVDTLSATAGEQVLLELGLILAEAGYSAREIAQKLDAEKTNVRVFAVVDTLEYLKKGGRISAATAVVGGLLNIKPAIAVQDGVVESVGKARGNKAANALLRQLVEKHGGINTQKPMRLLYAGASDENLRSFMQAQGDLFPQNREIPVAQVGAVIGTHVGPGAVALAYFER